jgi:hypothetical protein
MQDLVSAHQKRKYQSRRRNRHQKTDQTQGATVVAMEMEMIMETEEMVQMETMEEIPMIIMEEHLTGAAHSLIDVIDRKLPTRY